MMDGGWADYLADDEERFAELLARKSTADAEAEKKTLTGELTKSKMRYEMLPKLLKKLYEDNVMGKTSDDDYAILSKEFADERETLGKKILSLKEKIRSLDDSEGERSRFIKALRKFMQMNRLTGPLIRELIDHIDVYEQEGSGKNKRQRLVIYYKFIGYFDIDGIIKANYTADLREGVAVEYVTCEPTANQYDLYQGRIIEKHRAAQ